MVKMVKKETKRVNKIRNGDVFSIAISNGNYGLGQVIRKTDNQNVNAWLILFDKEFNELEVRNIKQIFLEEITILSIMPLNLILIKNKTWAIIDNREPVKVNIPMFQDLATGPKKYMIYNMERTMLRFHDNILPNSMISGFSRGPIYFTHLCEFKWGNPDMVPPHATKGKRTWDTYYHYWPVNCPTEDDMIINAHLYQRWPNT